MAVNVKIHEFSNQLFDFNRIEESVKIQRGWIHLMEDRYGYHRLVWSMRKRQDYCEELFVGNVSNDELLELWTKRELTYTLHGRRVRKSKPPRDSQRQKCYDWERLSFFNRAKRFSNDEMTSFIKKVAVGENIKGLKVKYRSAGMTSFSKGMNELAFLPCHMNDIVACHEIAHTIVTRKYLTKAAGHGPEWVATYMYLLVKYCGLDLSRLQASAQKFGVNYIVE